VWRHCEEELGDFSPALGDPHGGVLSLSSCCVLSCFGQVQVRRRAAELLAAKGGQAEA
jgi:hypothetical protein